MTRVREEEVFNLMSALLPASHHLLRSRVHCSRSQSWLVVRMFLNNHTLLMHLALS